MILSYGFIIFNDIPVHDGRDTPGCATLWLSVHLSERSLAGAKCLIYSRLSDSVVVAAQEILKVFRACGGGRRRKRSKKKSYHLEYLPNLSVCNCHDLFWTVHGKIPKHASSHVSLSHVPHLRIHWLMKFVEGCDRLSQCTTNICNIGGGIKTES